MDKKPWEWNGRWYRLFVESDGTTITVTSVDKDLKTAAVSGSYLKLPKDIHVIDYFLDFDNDSTAAATFEKGLRLYADGSVGLVLPEASQFTACYVYAFAHF